MFNCVITYLTMKRNENVYSFSNKRAKLQQDIDDIWGDDPEIDEFDRCINLATQICSEDVKQNRVNNTLNFTTYDDFKVKGNIQASTQAFLPSNIPSTSGFPNQNNRQNYSGISIRSNSTVVTRDASDEEIPKLLQKIQSLETEKKKLTEMYATKNGENTIIRSQLQQAQKAVSKEKMAKLQIMQENEQNWEAKLNVVNKDMNGLKCELDLRNLEIANLREKLTELKKVCCNSMNMTILHQELNGSQTTFKRNIKNESRIPTVCKNIQTEPNFYLYPRTSSTILSLQFSIPETFFEKCYAKNNVLKLNSNSSYSHNFTTFPNVDTSDKIETNEISLICISNFYPNIQRLFTYSYEELNNSKDVLYFVDKIVNLTKTSLLKLNNQLTKFCEELTHDYFKNMNAVYLEENKVNYKCDCIFSGNLWHENETAVEIRRYIAILSSLVLHCERLYRYFISQDLILNEIKMDVDGELEYEFLNLFLEIVTNISNIRRSDQFCGLLSAILKLLGNLSTREDLPSNCYEIMNKIFKKILFCRPSNSVLKYAAEFLNLLSRHQLFVVKLCILKKLEGTQSSMKDGLVSNSEDTCVFKILSTELEICEMDVDMCLNVMQFLTNLLTSNFFWTCHLEDQRCICLIGVYSLGIHLFSTLLKIPQLNKNSTDQIEIHNKIFQIGLVFLDILIERVPGLLVRYSHLSPQYQTVIKYICKTQKSFLKKDNETAKEDLISEINSDVQKRAQNTNNEHVFNNKLT